MTTKKTLRERQAVCPHKTTIELSDCAVCIACEKVIWVKKVVSTLMISFEKTEVF